MTVAAKTTFDSEKTTKELNALVREIEEDLHERLEKAKRAEKTSSASGHELKAVDAYRRLKEHHAHLLAKELTAQKWAAWCDEQVSQIAAAWVLSLTFLRYLEDHGHLREPWLSGATAEERRQADNYRKSFFKGDTLGDTDREYFLSLFQKLAKLPGCSTLFGEGHNPLWEMGPSGDGARRLWEFFREIDGKTGELKRDFRGADTRFLGDLYQNLSKKARKRYALLQTPDFVEEFILDHALKPAWDVFGPEETKLIDPACGSGHFLLGAFGRFFEHFRNEDLNAENHVLAQKALDRVFGVDLNPFAIAIARFRLLLAAMTASGERDLAACFNFKLNLAVGDSLLCGKQFDARSGQFTIEGEARWGTGSFTQAEYDLAEEILSRRYEVVVGNPPYITDKDKAHRERVRGAYTSASGKFSLGVPFTERFFNLACAKPSAGFVGMITANSFTKRDFGKTFIEEIVPHLDLTHVIDTSGAYLPGHGTPTLTLFGRNQSPRAPEVRAVLGIRGEPAEPKVPAEGKVWASIATLTDGGETENDFVTVVDLKRKRLKRHPWITAGGGVIEFMDHLESRSSGKVGELARSVGPASFSGQDEVFIGQEAQFLRLSLKRSVRSYIYGSAVRNWALRSDPVALVPYSACNELHSLEELGIDFQRYMWPFRTNLGGIKSFGDKTKAEEGGDWWNWYRWVKSRLDIPLSLTFAFVATHNHFSLARGGSVFSRTAPVVKLAPDASASQYLVLAGLLNSSIANFVFRQTCFPKGGDSVGSEGARVSKNPWEDRLERSGAAVEAFPLVDTDAHLQKLAVLLDKLGQENEFSIQWSEGGLSKGKEQRDNAYCTMVAAQEELDWHVYNLYGLEPKAPVMPIDDSLSGGLPPVKPGERPFEIYLARKVLEGVENDVWFTRHGITPITEVPDHWPEDYQQVVRRRLELIESERFYRLLEAPVHKRRWSRESWDDLVHRKLEGLLLDRLETPAYWPTPRLQNAAELAQRAKSDEEFYNWAELYTGEQDPDLGKLVESLVSDNGVPYLDGLVYTKPGLRKRARWKETWELQRAEDAGKAVDIPVPPTYVKDDFQKEWYSHRGKLDVPKERFILYPGAEREGTRATVAGWAGWNHAQRAEALASYYQEAKQVEGWEKERLIPLLAGIHDLVPWLKQWHNNLDPITGFKLGDFYESFVAGEAPLRGVTPAELDDKLPPG